MNSVGFPRFWKQGMGKVEGFQSTPSLPPPNDNGNYEWLRWIDGTGSDTSNDIQCDMSGNVYVFGNSDTSSQISIAAGNGNIASPTAIGASTKCFIIKYNSIGTYQWIRWIGTSTGVNGTCMKIDISGNIIIVGSASSNVSFDSLNGTSRTILNPGPAKPGGTTSGIFIAKYNTDGIFQWLQWLDGNGTENGSSIDADANGNIYLLGQSSDNLILSTPGGNTNITLSNKPDSNFGVFLAKYNSSGMYQWIQWIDSGFGENPGSLTLDSNGNVTLIGIAQTDVTITSSNGTTKSPPKLIGNQSQNAFMIHLEITNGLNG